MLNAFTAKRMTDGTSFSHFELMRKRFIELCEAYIENAAKNSAFSCSFIYYFNADDEIAKCEDYLWHADVQDALQDAGYDVEIRDNRENNCVAININWRLMPTDAQEEIEVLKDMIVNGFTNSKKGKKSHYEFIFSNDDERVMGEIAIGLAERQLKPDIIVKHFDEIIWGADYDPCIKYIVSVEWK